MRKMKTNAKTIMIAGWLAAGAMSGRAALTVDWTATANTVLGTNFVLNITVNSEGGFELVAATGGPATIMFTASGTTGIPELIDKSFSLTFSSVNGQNFAAQGAPPYYRMGMGTVNDWRFSETGEVARITADLSQLSSNLTFRLKAVEILNAVIQAPATNVAYTVGLRNSSGVETVSATNTAGSTTLQLAEISPLLSGGGTDFFEYRAASGNAGGWGSLTFDFGIKDAFETPIRLASIFSSGCVLQRDQTVPVWGTCEPGETIAVTVHEQSKTVVADENGNWRVELDPEPAGGFFTMTVSGQRSVAVVLTDVCFGDVWMLTGQSNMFLMLRSHFPTYASYYPPPVPDPATDNYNNLRFVIVGIVGAETPQKDAVIDLAWSTWQADKLSTMSTVGYFFARALRQTLDANGMENVPIGIIKVCRGATAAEQWMSSEALATLDEPLIADPSLPESIYYNGMVAPIEDYAVKGMLWHQGGSNARNMERIKQYPILFRKLVESWREKKGIDFPVYFAQQEPYMGCSPVPEDHDVDRTFANLAWLREAQAAGLAIPGTKMVCIIDYGHQNQAHPPHKDKLGDRFARVVLKDAYGVSTVSRGPVVRDVQFSGADVLITYDEIAAGLETRAVDAQPDEEEIAEGFPAVSVSADELAGFALCGEDRVFYWASSAEIISSNQVRVSNAIDVPQPVAVRYAWQSFPRCNLYNSAGLPAEPFRTDAYEYRTSSGAQSTPLSFYQSWQYKYFTATQLNDSSAEMFLWGDCADSDGDGIPNLLEYALGHNPVRSDQNVRPLSIVHKDGMLKARILKSKRINADSSVALGIQTTSGLLNPDGWIVPPAADTLYQDLGDAELRDIPLGSGEESERSLFVRLFASRTEN